MEYYDVIRGEERERLAHLAPGGIMDAEVDREVFGYAGSDNVRGAIPLYSSIGEELVWEIVVAMRRHSRRFYMDHGFGWCAVSFTDAATFGKFNSQNVPEAVCKAALFCVRTLKREREVAETLKTIADSDSASFFQSKEEAFGIQGAL
jgi:hypothetical protein